MKTAILTYSFLLLFSSMYAVGAHFETQAASIGKGKNIMVKAIVNKRGIDGFSELVVDIPSTCMAVVTKKSGAKVLIGDQGQLKFIWLTMPTSNQIELEYKLIHIGKTENPVEVGGRFLYISGNVTSEKEVEKLSLPVTEETVLKTDAKVSKKEEHSYKIQLGVFSAKRSIGSFNGLPEIHYEEVNGIYKYYSGNYSSYSKAKAQVKTAKARGFKGAFVVRKKN